MRRMTRDPRGMTLIELIVVLNVMAMIIAISVPVYRMVQRRGRETACRANLSSVWTGIGRYKTDKKRFPFHLAELYPNYVPSSGTLACPSDPRRASQGIDDTDETSGLNLLYVRRDISETGEQIICGCPFHSHALVQYLDGRISVGKFQQARLLSPVSASVLKRESVTPAPASGETTLRPGDTVITGTGGSGVVTFDEGTTVTLGGNSQMVVKIALTADQPTKLVRVLGLFVNQVGGPPASAVADVAHGPYDGGGGRFEIQTPTAVAAVRGTKYRVVVQEVRQGNVTYHKTTVCPISGEVEVRGNGKSKKLKAGDDCVDVTATKTKVKKNNGKGNGKGNSGDDDDDDDDDNDDR